MAVASLFLLLLAVGRSAPLSNGCPWDPITGGPRCPAWPIGCELGPDPCGCLVCRPEEGEACGLAASLPGCASGLTCTHAVSGTCQRDAPDAGNGAKQQQKGVQPVPIVDLVPYCDHVTDAEGCRYGNVTIPVGEQCKVDDCTWCYCPVAGQNPGCVTQDCPAPPCPNPVKIPGQCCMVCHPTHL
ncbi:cysteine-rich motor neuron 1 protein-like [Branchiostoma lanceolatum]|uniref:cysteine-rich motor neuron 1 protein-like n=1 Tax=Branchiostoma lanceolatum TaxID=7740 RepID=UPI0034565799